jgi:hypothetical protein
MVKNVPFPYNYRQSLSLSGDGNTFADGYPYVEYNTGVVRVFRRTGWDSPTQWQQLGNEIWGGPTEQWKGVGMSLSLSRDGNTLAVGAFLSSMTDSNNLEGATRVYQYDLLLDDWVQKGNTVWGTQYRVNTNWGIVDISADGNIMAISSVRYSSDLLNQGAIRVFKYTTNNEQGDGQWIQMGQSVVGKYASIYLGERTLSLTDDGLTFFTSTSSTRSPTYSAVYTYDDSNPISPVWVQVGSDFPQSYYAQISRISSGRGPSDSLRHGQYEVMFTVWTGTVFQTLLYSYLATEGTTSDFQAISWLWLAQILILYPF